MTSTNIYVDQIHVLSLPNKYTRWYTSIILKSLQRCSTRAKAKEMLGYVEGHHIVPRSFKLGGEWNVGNIAFLTAREHFICHWLLTKMFSDTNLQIKMSYALGRLRTRNDTQERMTASKYYDIARRHHISALSRRVVTVETRLKMTLSRIGKTLGPRGPMSEQHKQAISAGNKDKPKSEEHKQNLRKPKPKLPCSACGKMMSQGLLTRFHNDNCKSFVNSSIK